MLIVVPNEEHKRWDELVRTFKNHDIYYYSHHAKLYEIHGDGTPLLIYYADETCRMMQVVMLRDISEDKRFKNKIEANKYFDLSTSYGYGGFLFEGNYTKHAKGQLKQEYLNYSSKNNIISEIVRYHPLLDNAKDSQILFTTEEIGETITIDLADEQTIWENFESSNRNDIRKAKHSGVKVYWGMNKELMDQFIPLYYSTMDRNQASDYYYFSREYFDHMLENLGKNVMIFYAMLGDKTIAMSIVYLSNYRMHYHLSASDPDYNHLNPMSYLLSEAALWGAENGFTCFHLGGGQGEEKDGLTSFKRKFNRNSNTVFSIGKRIYDQKKYNELVKMRGFRKAERSFFPLYRSE